jgi:hypothetical protein
LGLAILENAQQAGLQATRGVCRITEAHDDTWKAVCPDVDHLEWCALSLRSDKRQDSYNESDKWSEEFHGSNFNIGNAQHREESDNNSDGSGS